MQCPGSKFVHDSDRNGSGSRPRSVQTQFTLPPEAWGRGEESARLAARRPPSRRSRLPLDLSSNSVRPAIPLGRSGTLTCTCQRQSGQYANTPLVIVFTCATSSRRYSGRISADDSAPVTTSYVGKASSSRTFLPVRFLCRRVIRSRYRCRSIKRLPSAFARFAASRSPSAACTIEPFIRMCQERAKASGSRSPASSARSRTRERMFSR
jgi:hypothetical protein